MPLGTCSFALLPFWRFDDKGGDCVLLGCFVGFAWDGTQACPSIDL